MASNNTTVTDFLVLYYSQLFGLLRHSVELTVVYCTAYGVVFFLGLVGNLFVVAAVMMNSSMRNITNYCISSLAIADLLIIIFCLPATLMNNILNEWLLGNVLCKVSVWVNGTTSCTSVFTLVAVTADRYAAICHTMRYNSMEKKKTFWVIIPIWFVSAILFVPSLMYFHAFEYPPPNLTAPYPYNSTIIMARICYPTFPSRESERLFFLVVNFLIAFLIPLIMITVCYTFIFAAIFRRTPMAVDHKAAQREHRMKIKVTNMMLIVIILFAASWLPLYCLFTYIFFGNPSIESPVTEVIQTVLRPVFQWLSLANSCINPALYAYFSARFRRAFQEILVLPCRRRYQRVRLFARNTMKRYSSTRGGGSRSVTHQNGLDDFTEFSEIPQESGRNTARKLASSRNQQLNGRNLKLMHRKPTGPNKSRPPCKRQSTSQISSAASVAFTPSSSIFEPESSKSAFPGKLRTQNQLNAAPVLTMRDLDISSINFSPSVFSRSSGEKADMADYSGKRKSPSCRLRFAQIAGVKNV